MQRSMSLSWMVPCSVQEWPHNWPTFISDIVNAGKANETLCENNMLILKLLSEEVRAGPVEQGISVQLNA